MATTDRCSKGSPEMLRAPVLIIGGGIVGLSASLFLSSHRVASLLVERHAGTSMHPRARGLNRRTMELFRGLGIDGPVRAAGACLAPSQGIYRGASLAEAIGGHPRHRPGIQRRITAASRFLGTLGPVEGTRGTQDMVEPVLLQAARDRGGDLRFSAECVGLEQDAAGVTATLRDRPSGTEHIVRASHVIAADGAGSPARHSLGVPTTGAGALGHLLNILFEADLGEFVRGREFSMCLVDQPGRVAGLFTSINNRERWVFHLSFDPARGEEVDDFPPERCAELVRVALGMPDIKVDVKSVLPWEPTVRVAERFQHGRVFLAGDAAHQMPPWGGQGANTGIADAHNLAWKLAAVARGQAGPALLETYDVERQPVGRLVAEESGLMADERGLFTFGNSLAAALGIVRRLPRLGGYGHTYVTSRAICTEDTTPWPWKAVALAPRPSQFLGIGGSAGHRVPHIWVTREGKQISTLDVLGDGFVVLAGAGGGEWVKSAQDVASSLGVDIAAYRVGPRGELVTGKGSWESAAGISTSGALLVRPDGFVAWRSYGSPQDVRQKLGDVLERVLCR